MLVEEEKITTAIACAFLIKVTQFNDILQLTMAS